MMETSATGPECEDRLFAAARSERNHGDTSRAFDPRHLGQRIGQGAVRGAIAAMAMTGLREFTRHVGLLEEPPPESIGRRNFARRWFPGVERGPRRARIELVHWSVGAAGGALFAALPSILRRSRWSGPLYGLLVWGSFELAIAPLLALPQTRRIRPLDRLALAGDHLLYGAMLSEYATLRSDAPEA